MTATKAPRPIRTKPKRSDWSRTESALSLPAPPDLAGMSDEQLTQEARAGLEASQAGRRAFLAGVRRAGAAFAAMKARYPKRYTAWLKEHFQKSPQTARTYVRVHENWALIESSGWEEESLRSLDLLIAAAKAGRGRGKGSGRGDPLNGGQPTADEGEAPASQNRQVVLPFRADEKEEFEDALDWLCENLRLESRSDAALAAARRWRQEEEGRRG